MYVLKYLELDKNILNLRLVSKIFNNVLTYPIYEHILLSNSNILKKYRTEIWIKMLEAVMYFILGCIKYKL